MPKTNRNKKHKNKATATAIATVVTPVAKFRKKLEKGKKQTTLAQMFHDSDATESVVSEDKSSEEESSEEESFKTKRKNKSPTVTPVTKRFKSSATNYSEVEVGDLVMCTAREADHPLYEDGIIDKAFILFGIVKAFLLRNGIPK